MGLKVCRVEVDLRREIPFEKGQYKAVKFIHVILTFSFKVSL